MKHLNSRSSDSLLSTISSSSPTDDMCLTEDRYEIQAMLDSLEDSLNGEDHNEMESHPTKGKKRRLNLTQVKALEKHFQADNKLEPQRKVKLAMELGLQPRQVAVWFQNRRARWKNKQLEKEYEVLKSSYEELKRSYENVGREKELLKAELGDLKLKLGDASESESDNPNNTATVDEPVVDYGQHQTWSCSSSSLMQLDCSASYFPENLSWFQSGIGEAGADGGSACPSWFNFEVDY